MQFTLSIEFIIIILYHFKNIAYFKIKIFILNLNFIKKGKKKRSNAYKVKFIYSFKYFFNEQYPFGTLVKFLLIINVIPSTNL